jgi:5,6-dimethylbenzimidazole synthase
VTQATKSVTCSNVFGWSDTRNRQRSSGRRPKLRLGSTAEKLVTSTERKGERRLLVAEIAGSKAEDMTFDEGFRSQLRELLTWRRDVRGFRSEALPPGALKRLINLACLAPSVGLSQPWRFVIVDGAARRRAVVEDFKACNAAALASYADDLATRYSKLKLAGLEEAPCHLAVFADPTTDVGHGLGRHTMPEMIDYSVVTAIHTMWLAARAEGIGMGWVSIMNPAYVSKLLEVPNTWRLIGYFCIGFPRNTSDTPELERASWERRRASREVILRR